MHIGPQLGILFQIIVIDLSLAGDNALVIGATAAGLPPERRRRAMTIGLGAAVALRIVLAFFAVRLLQFAGLTLAGGLLLLWVAWKMWRDLRRSPNAKAAGKTAAPGTLASAVWQILAADLAMSLDNVLAVAGAARDHYPALVLGLVLSVALMGAAATLTAKWMERRPWLGWIGIAVVVYVALRMIVDGVAAIH